MRLELVALLAAWVGTICLFVVVPWTAIRVVSAVLAIGESRADGRRIRSVRDSFVESTETPLVASEEPPVDRAEPGPNWPDTDELSDRGTKT